MEAVVPAVPPHAGRIPVSRRKHPIHPAGTCAICRHRDQSRHHGAAFCAGDFRRQHPTCTWDQRKPRFALDLQAIKAIGATP